MSVDRCLPGQDSLQIAFFHSLHRRESCVLTGSGGGFIRITHAPYVYHTFKPPMPQERELAEIKAEMELPEWRQQELERERIAEQVRAAVLAQAPPSKYNAHDEEEEEEEECEHGRSRQCPLCMLLSLLESVKTMANR